MPTFVLGRVLGPQGPQGEKGDPGAQGVQGLQGTPGNDGVTPNIQVGTVTTLAAGSPATVERAAESPDAAPVFNFGIPRGADAPDPGDMQTAVYDPQGKAEDVFNYVDQEIASAKLLPEATAAKLGVSENPNMNDALDALASHYGTCATAAATKAKVVTLAGFKLATGAVVAVKFTYGNTADAPTLNVNGTGAKSIAVYGTTAAGSGAWSAGEVVLFVYDGTRWVINSGAVLGAGNACKKYVGSYTGTDANSVSLTFPELPVYLILGQCELTANGSNTFFRGFIYDGVWLFASSGTKFCIVDISGSTISLTKHPNNSYSSVPNLANCMYRYIAFA